MVDRSQSPEGDWFFDGESDGSPGVPGYGSVGNSERYYPHDTQAETSAPGERVVSASALNTVLYQYGYGSPQERKDIILGIQAGTPADPQLIRDALALMNVRREQSGATQEPPIDAPTEAELDDAYAMGREDGHDDAIAEIKESRSMRRALKAVAFMTTLLLTPAAVGIVRAGEVMSRESVTQHYGNVIGIKYIAAITFDWLRLFADEGVIALEAEKAHPAAPATVPAATATSTGRVTSVGPPSPRPTATATATPTSSATTTLKNSGRTSFVPLQLPNGVVQGASAYYKDISPQQVDTMERCGNETDAVLLTFDDFGSKDHIREIANVLKQKNTGAIFFLNTGKVGQDTIDELRKDGFWVGNHTAAHPDLTKLSDADITAAITSGGPATLFRPPYGATWVNKQDSNRIYFETKVKTLAEAAGKNICMWTVDTRDWAKGATVESITDTVKEQVRPGSTVLMHAVDVYPTLEALPGIFDAIAAQGLRTCKLGDKPTTKDIPASLPC